MLPILDCYKHKLNRTVRVTNTQNEKAEKDDSWCYVGLWNTHMPKGDICVMSQDKCVKTKSCVQ